MTALPASCLPPAARCFRRSVSQTMRRAKVQKTVVPGLLSVMTAVAAGNVAAQVTSSTTIGVSPDEVKTLACGWLATKQIFGKPVYNDQDERVGEVEGRKAGLAASSRLASHLTGGRPREAPGAQQKKCAVFFLSA